MKVQKYRLELVRESNGNYEFEKDKMSSPQDVCKLVNDIFKMNVQAEEVFICLCLDTKNKIVGAFEVARGALASAIIHPREVYKRALLCNAASMVVAHNHPSGSVDPSPEDNAITKRLFEAGELLGVKLLDHLIVGESYAYHSYKESGNI